MIAVKIMPNVMSTARIMIAKRPLARPPNLKKRNSISSKLFLRTDVSTKAQGAIRH